MILVVNNCFAELDHAAAAFADAALLSTYVRPYTKLQRSWQQRAESIPGLARLSKRTFGRRALPTGVPELLVHQAGVPWDIMLAMWLRLPGRSGGYETIRSGLLNARTQALARAAARVFASEQAVVANWRCAEEVFNKAKRTNALCVLDYPLAHHRFARSYLRAEAERRPEFAGTLNGLHVPLKTEGRLDREIELADLILVGSTFARDTFVAEGVPEEKLAVVPYGADVRTFAPPTIPTRHKGRRMRLLFVGQIGQRKGVGYLLEAVNQMARRDVDLTLVGQIQGDGKAFRSFRHVFRHIPHVPRVELRKIYHQADVFVFPTLMEGMPLVILEAMASGLPVITTERGPSDIVRDGVEGFIVPPRDVDSIVEKIQVLQHDPGLRAEMGRSARNRALQFTWANYRSRLLRLISVSMSSIDPHDCQRDHEITYRT